jgi:MraZ protein
MRPAARLATLDFGVRTRTFPRLSGEKWEEVGRGGTPDRRGGLSGFLGSFRHQIDDKGRLSLPASFRRDAIDRPLVLVQVHPDALTLYPETTWAEVEGRLRELLRRQPSSRAYVLGVTARAMEVIPDRQGRILIPQRLLESAGLRDSALLVGVIDRVEIWNPERFDAVVAQPDADSAQFANQVFG